MEVCAFLFFPWNFYLSIIEVIGGIAGPGCSSVGGGAFTELGPFYPTGDGRGLRINSMSWNKASNLLFVESPAGVGWSYSNTSSDYNTGDETTGENSVSLFFQVISLLFLDMFLFFEQQAIWLSSCWDGSTSSQSWNLVTSFSLVKATQVCLWLFWSLVWGNCCEIPKFCSSC